MNNTKENEMKSLMDPAPFDTAIRRLVMRSPERVRELTLTTHAHTMLQNIARVGDCGYTSRGYYNDHGPSLQSVSQKLKHLCTAGYLIRTEMLCMTGGIFYVYKIAESLRNES